jgi:hypothetical protein
MARAAWTYGAFLDAAYLVDSNDPPNHLFRNRGTTPRVNELDVNMAAAWLKKMSDESSRLGLEVTVQAGEDAKNFGFSATAPSLRGADVLVHLGPTNLSYLAPAGKGLTLQGGIFNSLIGYDALYVKDNFAYTRPWGADYRLTHDASDAIVRVEYRVDDSRGDGGGFFTHGHSPSGSVPLAPTQMLFGIAVVLAVASPFGR